MQRKWLRWLDLLGRISSRIAHFPIPHSLTLFQYNISDPTHCRLPYLRTNQPAEMRGRDGKREHAEGFTLFYRKERWAKSHNNNNSAVWRKRVVCAKNRLFWEKRENSMSITYMAFYGRVATASFLVRIDIQNSAFTLHVSPFLKHID